MKRNINNDKKLWRGLIAYLTDEVKGDEAAEVVRILEESGIGWRLYGKPLCIYCQACQKSGVKLRCSYYQGIECINASESWHERREKTEEVQND